MCSSDMFLGLVAILFPPIAVWVKCGICSADSLINLCLCMLGFLPGLLHAWYIIAKYPENLNEYDSVPQDAERGNARYIIVQSNGHSQRVQAPKNATKQGTTKPTNQGYGATAPLAPPVHQEASGAWDNGQEGSSGGAVPPSYEQATTGDHKVQSRD